MAAERRLPRAGLLGRPPLRRDGLHLHGVLAEAAVIAVVTIIVGAFAVRTAPSIAVDPQVVTTRLQVRVDTGEELVFRVRRGHRLAIQLESEGSSLAVKQLGLNVEIRAVLVIGIHEGCERRRRRNRESEHVLVISLFDHTRDGAKGFRA